MFANYVISLGLKATVVVDAEFAMSPTRQDVTNNKLKTRIKQIIIIEDTSFDRKHWGFNRVFMTFRNPQFHESVKNDLCTCPNDVRVFF